MARALIEVGIELGIEAGISHSRDSVVVFLESRVSYC
jgi:hypothetical protein